MKNIMKEAHNLTKMIIRKGDSYRATFRLCLSFVHSRSKQVAKTIEYKTMRGHKVSVTICEGITVSDLTLNGIKVIENNKDKWRCFLCDGYICVAYREDYRKIGASREAQITYNDEMQELYNDITIKNRIKFEKELDRSIKIGRMVSEYDRTHVSFKQYFSDINYI